MTLNPYKTLSATTLPAFLNDTADIRTIKLTKLILDLSEISSKYNKPFIIQGGFAVDLIAGNITRPHSDLDAITLEEDIEWWRQLFITDGYKLKYHEGQNEKTSFGAYKWNFIVEDSLYIDIDGIQIENQEVSDDGDKEKYIWPISSQQLFWNRAIDNAQVNFLNPQTIYDFKKAQQKRDRIRDKEGHDFKILSKYL